MKSAPHAGPLRVHQGESFEEALSDVESVIRFHVESFGSSVAFPTGVRSVASLRRYRQTEEVLLSRFLRLPLFRRCPDFKIISRAGRAAGGSENHA